ncbi:hypothetical protein [Acidianus manzaensis]|nr:hypothetical protein [Acidianus manzaensis]
MGLNILLKLLIGDTEVILTFSDPLDLSPEATYNIVISAEASSNKIEI